MSSGRNQYTAAIRFDPAAWVAYDSVTGARIVITELETFGEVVWRVTSHDVVVEQGATSNAKKARAAARRAVERLMKRMHRTRTARKETT